MDTFVEHTENHGWLRNAVKLQMESGKYQHAASHTAGLAFPKASGSRLAERGHSGYFYSTSVTEVWSNIFNWLIFSQLFTN